ncbi:S-layer homology domain-containing protein [Flavonifractor sp. An100]|uniref:S-layer homology domain-containing protein n=1 Tax=Flavonifractor sp. An100 TaxID=1965538 RepID=UPI000B392B19|nr:S-layer homology domain-containing protein [Flavonifractor sp. An100]OUQ78444.1 hypothetical protein B5E43_08145 [Flavonifractor sp. An100]
MKLIGLKRRASSLLLAMALAGQLTLPAAAVQGVEQPAVQGGDVVIEETFPDRTFRTWLLDRTNLGGVGADGILTQQEIEGIVTLNLSGMGLTDLSGVEVFFNLQILDCANNRLTELDVSGNPKLVRLYCGNNLLKELDLSNNPDIAYLACSFNRLSELNLAGHEKLIALNCEMNQMEKLDLSGCSELISLYCRNNQLEELDLTDNGKLEFIETFDNRLTTIDVRHLEALRFLHIDHNRLIELDMSHNQKLEGGGFVVHNNRAEKIFLPNQPGLMIDREDYEEQDPILGHDRVVWYLDPEFTTEAPAYLEAKGQTLYSLRIPNRYTIYFSANGGSGSMAGLSAVWDEEVELPESSFRRYGYTFSHWSEQAKPDERDPVYAAGESVQNLAGHNTDGDRVTLYACWQPNEYTIFLDPNGGEGERQSLSATYGKPVTLPEVPFHKDGKELAGWALQANGTVRYPDQGQVQNLTGEPEGEVTLYAVWRTPISELQKPYLMELDQLFQSYAASSGGKNYTSQDWETLSAAYQQAMLHYQELDAAKKQYLSTSVYKGLEDRHELAGQKRNEVQTLESAYGGLDLTQYSEKGQAALAQALKEGIEAIEQASSVAQAQQARTDAWAAISQVPVAGEEPEEPSEPPAGGGGSGGGGGAPEQPEEKPEGDTEQTVTDEKTGASAVVTTTADGAVSAQVTLPQGVDQAVLPIPCAGDINTVAVLEEKDGSTRVLPRSVYRNGVLTVRMERSGRIAIVQRKPSFTDVSEKDWFAQPVQFAASRELFSGIGGGAFGPNEAMSRAMLVTVLYQLEGRPETSQGTVFQDVPAGARYQMAAQWAAEQGITGGTEEGKFSPNTSISRESLALMLYRCAGSPKLSAGELEQLNHFQDGDLVSSWSREAMAWACANKILAGDPQGRLMPQEASTRAQVSTKIAQFVALTTQ